MLGGAALLRVAQLPGQVPGEVGLTIKQPSACRGLGVPQGECFPSVTAFHRRGEVGVHAYITAQRAASNLSPLTSPVPHLQRGPWLAWEKQDGHSEWSHPSPGKRGPFGDRSRWSLALGDNQSWSGSPWGMDGHGT